MSRQQADRTGEQIEERAQAGKESTKESSIESTKELKLTHGRSAREQDNPKRVQYGQGYSKDHPSKPGTDRHLSHSAGPSSKDTPHSTAKRS